jgi:iron complex outermembrane receptor protein
LEHGNGYVSARYEADNGRWLSLTSFGFKAERGVPPERHTIDPRLWRYPDQWRWVTAVSAGTGWRETPWGEGDLEASIGLDFGETNIDTYSNIAYDSITGGESGDDRTLSMRMLGDHTLGIGILRGALTAAETRHIEVIDDEDPETYKQWLFSLGLEIDQPLLPELDGSRARFSVGVSVDGAGTPLTGPADPRDPIWTWGARAGGTFALGDGSVVLNGGLSRRVRFPALRELYSGALGRFIVNPELDPEVLGVFELGATFEVGTLNGQAVVFHQRLTDAIVRVAVGEGQLQRQNRDRITSTGLELLFEAPFGPLTVAGDATIQNVNLDDPTAPDDQRNPEYQPWFNGGLFGTLNLGRGFWTSASVRHQASRYCVHPDSDDEVRLASNTWSDLELGKSFGLGGVRGRRLDAVVALDNFTDSSVFDQCGLPRPGRLLRLQMQIF